MARFTQNKNFSKMVNHQPLNPPDPHPFLTVLSSRQSPNSQDFSFIHFSMG